MIFETASSKLSRSGLGASPSERADDEVNADQRPFREEQIEGRYPAIIDLRQIGADLFA